MDNTFAGFHNHGSFDIDLFLHSLTKYASGHGDVMGGAIIARRELIDAMRKDVASFGPTLDPHAAFLIQRGMRTYVLRYERQCANALGVSRFLEAHPRVKRVYYPGLASHPQHELAKRQMSDFGAVVSFELDGGYDEKAVGLPRRSRTSRLPRVWARRNRWWCRRDCSAARSTRRRSARLSLIGPRDRTAVHRDRGVEDLIADLTQALDRAFPFDITQRDAPGGPSPTEITSSIGDSLPMLWCWAVVHEVCQ